MNFITLAALLLTLFSIRPAQAIAEEIKGKVYTSGNPGQRWTRISQTDNQMPTTLCPSELALGIAKLTNAKVTLKGNWGLFQDRKTKCFAPTEITINEIDPGRPAIIGVLKETGKNEFAIENQTGKQWKIAKLSKGLLELKNKLVIADLVASNGASSSTVWLVAKMYEHPDTIPR